MKNLISFLICSILMTTSLNSQDIYLLIEGNKIARVSGNSVQTIATFDMPLYDRLTDIAIAPDQTFYGVNGNRLIEIDIESETLQTVGQLAGGSNSLVCSNDFELYYISSETLYKYDLATQSNENIAYLGFTTPGDLCFYKGNILFLTHNAVKAYNLESHSLTTIHYLTAGTSWGMTMVNSDCNSNQLLIKSSFGLSNLQLGVIDLATENLELYMTLPFNENLHGMASSDEFLGSTCESIELEGVDEDTSTSNTRIDSAILDVYPNPVQNILTITGLENGGTAMLYNNLGILVRSQTNPRTQFDLTDLNSGIYFIALENNVDRRMIKIIIN